MREGHWYMENTARRRNRQRQCGQCKYTNSVDTNGTNNDTEIEKCGGLRVQYL